MIHSSKLDQDITVIEYREKKRKEKKNEIVLFPYNELNHRKNSSSSLRDQNPPHNEFPIFLNIPS